ncbi:MAG: hypothetical protein QOG15_2366, partial [Solirubrobacteraceae bacterium]|nr:hypothetical protein [Solirubrobacteraceae bacterium]
MAHLAKAVARALLLLCAQVAPEVEKGEEVRGFVLEARVVLIGLPALVGGSHARVLNRQRRRDHDHLVGAAEPVGLEHHAPHARVDRQLREAAAELRQPLAMVLRFEIERPELVQQQLAVSDLTAVGRIEEAEVLDLAEPQRLHLQDHGGERRAQDLGIGECGALREVLLGVQADADAIRRAPAAAGALVRGGLRDRLDRQTLHLQTRAVTADPRGAGVDDGADPGHGQRGLGDVRGEHDAALAVRLEHPLLLGRRQARVEREDGDLLRQPGGQRLGGVADLALAAEEDEHVAGPLADQLLDGAADRVDRVTIGPDLLLLVVERRLGAQWPVAHLDGIRAAGHLDDRRVAEVAAEAPGIDRRARDDELEVRALGQQPVQVAEQEV